MIFPQHIGIIRSKFGHKERITLPDQDTESQTSDILFISCADDPLDQNIMVAIPNLSKHQM